MPTDDNTAVENGPRDSTPVRRGRGRVSLNGPGGIPAADQREKMSRLRALWPPGPRPYGSHRLKLDAILRAEDRPAYEALLNDPKTSVAHAHKWLRERGYQIGHVAVGSHKSRFNQSLKDLRHAARFATALRDLFAQHGTATLSEITLTRVQQLVMERLFKTDGDGTALEIPLDDLCKLAKLVEGATATRKQVDHLRREFEESKRQAAAAARTAAKAGGDGRAVADRVREILGIPAGEGSEEG